MIPQNELRIGNFIQDYRGFVRSVTSIQYGGIFCKEPRSYIEYERIDPILITGDWLIRFGFEKGGPNAFATNYYIGRFGVSHHFKDGLYYSWTANIKHIHQLQNLYFAITGKELEFK